MLLDQAFWHSAQEQNYQQLAAHAEGVLKDGLESDD